jgi:dephospho-CoA kinase
VYIAGLTGGIASGKSTVSEMFRQAGAVIIDADIIAREVVEPGMPAWGSIVKTFGRGVIAPDGGIDRTRLGEIVFNNSRLRKALEHIVHPRVRDEVRVRMKSLERRSPGAVVIHDIPLLFESGMTEGLAEIVVVYVPLQTQLDRLMIRDGLSEADARLRIAAQMPLEEKRNRADVVIDNRGDRRRTREQVVRIYRRFALRAGGDV